uniref:U3 small nucleolar RNA-associated protein 20 N-terminal domain-containing protein n=1 Tax=Setaria digitata TaxID=48799 RepID=A0A915PHK9_9BILA
MQRTFKYVSFTEQIAKVSVDVARWHPSITVTTLAENETRFNDAVTKYRELDYGSYFESFLKDIPYFNGELRTYAQLLHRKDVVAKALISHLNISGSTSLRTLLELTTAFVQDVKEDLRNYLWEFIEAIIGILERSHEDKEILETIFFTIAKIFWLQRRYLVHELCEVFRRFKRVFCCKRAYSRRFIAEALAFLLRKSNAEINNLLLVDGISRLYFNALKITKGQFHNTAPQLLSEILQASFSIEENNVRNVAIKILVDTMRYCSTYTSKEYSGLLLDVILNQYKLAVASSSVTNTSALAELLTTWISQKMGRSLHKPSSLFQVIIDRMNCKSEKVEKETIELLCTAIARYQGDSQLHSLITAAVRTLMSDLERCDLDLILDFLHKISDIPLFDLCIMPIVGTFMSQLIVREDVDIINRIFEFYADLCSKRRPMWKYKEGRICFFDVSWHLKIRSQLTNILASADKFDGKTVGCCLMVYPWLWSKSENLQEIAAVFKILVNSMSSEHKIDARLALLAAHACFLCDPGLFNQFTLDTLLKYYKNMGSNELALRTLALMLPFVKDLEELKNVAVLSKVANEILPMFGHCNGYVRQTALEILTHFNIPVSNEERDDGTVVEVESAFELLLRSEKTPWTLEEYRTRLMILRQLTYGAHRKHMPQGFDTVIETIPLRVIVGNLYEPFTIAWSELKNIIEDYAYGLNIDIFFQIFLSFIEQARLKSQGCDSSNDLLDKMTNISGESPRNHGAFRLEMFGILSRISDLCERRTRLLSPLFLNFFKNEYQRDSLLYKKENISLVVPSGSLYSADEDTVLDDANDVQQLFSNEKSEVSDKKTEDEFSDRKIVRSSLIALLELFAKFNSPKSIYMTNEIQDLYDELLMVGDDAVQQRALKCIFAYNYKYLIPYREHLENIVQERTLISGLVKFPIDNQNSVIDSNHRTNVMPIVLRLLYGKCNMHCKKDMMERRAAIFRFLVGSTSDELDFFLKLLFAPLIKIIGEEKKSLEEFCSQTISTFDASCMVPLAVIRGFAFLFFKLISCLHL